jgi:signal peptidase II
VTFWLSFLLIFALDQATKAMVRINLDPGQSVPVLPGLFHVTYVRNPGGAFGLLPAASTLFLAASIVALIVIVGFYVWRRPSDRLMNLALGLIAAGTAGNLVDRLFHGQVIDWLDFRVWPVFNVADVGLVVGLGLLSVEIFRSTAKESTE